MEMNFSERNLGKQFFTAKKTNVLLVFLLLFQTIISGIFTPFYLSAEGEKANVFTSVSFKDEDGETVGNIEDLESVSVYIDWSIAGAEIEPGDTATTNLPQELIIDTKTGQLLVNNEPIANYEINQNNRVNAVFTDEVIEHPDGNGTIVIEATQEIEVEESQEADEKDV